MVTKGIYLFWDKKYEQVIYGGRFTGRQRIKEHFYPYRRNEQQINKYVQNHPDRIDSVIFCEFDDISDNDLNQLEMETIKLFKLNRYKYPDSHVFNFTDGGGGISGFTHSEESKNKMSEANSGENHPNYEKHLSEETKKKISEARTGTTLSEETKKKMSVAKSGENNPMFGKHHSEEGKKKISENHADFSGENHPQAKYTLWDVKKCHYVKSNMFRRGNDGMNPLRCFVSKYNGKKLPIGTYLDFYTPELINDLINEFLEVN